MKTDSVTLDNYNQHNAIPRDWRVVKLKEISYINPRPIAQPIPDEMKVSFLPMKNVEEQTGKFDLSLTKTYKDVRKGYTPFVDRDIIFAKITPCMENGKIAIVDNLTNGIGFGSTEFHVVRLVADLSRKFFFFYLLQENFRREARQKMKGTAGQLRVPTTYLEEVSVPFPPLKEQKRIVSKLEELFTKLDTGIEYLKKTQTLLKQYRQSVLIYAFEGKLTEKWRKQNHQKHRSTSIENNRVFNYNYFLFKENKIPENWNWYALSDIAKIGQGGTPSTSKKEYWNGKIPWIRSGEVNWNRVISSSSTISKNGLNDSSAKLLPKDTVLLAMTGEGLTRGRSAILDVECATNQSVAFIIPDKMKILSEFLFYYFWKEYWNIREIKKGSNQPGLNTSVIKNFLIPLPNIDEQYQILLKIEKYLSLIQNSEKIIQSSEVRSKFLRNSILKDAFEGKLVPQDPRDEPVEILLEKIKKEKSIIHYRNNSKVTKNKSGLKQMRLV